VGVYAVFHYCLVLVKWQADWRPYWKFMFRLGRRSRRNSVLCRNGPVTQFMWILEFETVAFL